MAFRSSIWFVFLLNLHFHFTGCNAENKTQSAFVQETEKSPAALSLGPTALAAIIASLLGLFIITIALQFVIKKIFRKKRSCTDESRQRDAEEETSVQTPIPIEHSLPPSYDEIHRYKQLNDTLYTAVYYSVPATQKFYGIAFDKDDQTKDFPNEEPPPYELDNAEEQV